MYKRHFTKKTAYNFVNFFWHFKLLGPKDNILTSLGPLVSGGTWLVLHLWRCPLPFMEVRPHRKMKRSFFQAVVVSILLYGCTNWTLTKQPNKKLYGNYTRMLRAILNKSWRQRHPKYQQYGPLLPITKTLQVRRTRHAGHC